MNFYFKRRQLTRAAAIVAVTWFCFFTLFDLLYATYNYIISYFQNPTMDRFFDLLEIVGESLLLSLTYTRDTLVYNFIFILLGVLFGYVFLFIYNLNKKKFVQKGRWRNLTSFVGSIPKIPKMKKSEININFDGFTDKHAAFIKETFDILNAQPDAYAGAGHEDNLFLHSQKVFLKSLEQEDADPLLPLVAAAHDIGKLNSYRFSGTRYELISNVEIESVKIISLMDSWYDFDLNERNLVIFAVKYNHSPELLPVNVDHKDRLNKIISELKIIDGSITAQEKESVRNKVNEESFDEAILNALANIKIQSKDTMKGKITDGFYQKDILYIKEKSLSEEIQQFVPVNVAAALNANFYDKNNLSEFTQLILKRLNKMGILLKKSGNVVVPVEESVWNIKSGKTEFTRIIIINATEEILNLMPTISASTYSIKILGTVSGKRVLNISPPIKVEETDKAEVKEEKVEEIEKVEVKEEKVEEIDKAEVKEEKVEETDKAEVKEEKPKKDLNKVKNPRRAKKTKSLLDGAFKQEPKKESSEEKPTSKKTKKQEEENVDLDEMLEDFLS